MNFVFPDEIFAKIITYCDLKTSLEGVGLTCKKLRHLALTFGPKRSFSLSVADSGICELLKFMDYGLEEDECQLFGKLEWTIAEVEDVVKRMPSYCIINSVSLGPCDDSVPSQLESLFLTYRNRFRVQKLCLYRIEMRKIIELLAVPQFTSISLTADPENGQTLLDLVRAMDLRLTRLTRTVRDETELDDFLGDLIRKRDKLWKNCEIEFIFENPLSPTEENVVAILKGFGKKAAEQNFVFQRIRVGERRVSRRNPDFDAEREELYMFKGAPFIGYRYEGGRYGYYLQRRQKFPFVAVKLSDLGYTEEECLWERYTAKIFAKRKFMVLVRITPRCYDHYEMKAVQRGRVLCYGMIPNYNYDFVYFTYFDLDEGSEEAVDLEWLDAKPLEDAVIVERLSDDLPFSVEFYRD